ncbi:hypothetical protein CBR_g31638 [Chara braunii]|uniref:Uncharacterized protein n=1 Tax=Chara braunii TaxID=69332 RepID=A0A388LFI1_CHABU|nr:hypothetical protein CBR_g31638 [Chara braunii]|eukprot:GBG81080.1 hypothetical protein CBR_g31638 [Chara braunii]
MMVKLLGSVSTGRVAYVEAEKDFVDVLLTLLALPVAFVAPKTDLMEPPLPALRNHKLLIDYVGSQEQSQRDRTGGIDQVAFVAPKTNLMEPPLPALRNHELLIDYVGSQGQSQTDRNGTDAAREMHALTSRHEVPLSIRRTRVLEKVVDVPRTSTTLRASFPSRRLSPSTSMISRRTSTTLRGLSRSTSMISPQQSFTCPEHAGSSKALGLEVEVEPTVTGTSGFVKEGFTFMITDDLQIFRLSTIRSIQLLNEMKITNMGDLSGVQVNVGKEEVTYFTLALVTPSSSM